MTYTEDGNESYGGPRKDDLNNFIKVSYIQIFALVAPIIALTVPVPADTQATTDANAESFFIQTDVGWSDGGDSKKREAAKKPGSS
ncbi:hypothetical protein QIS74_09812 [Colletotrichum tabaci]|uniref:Uncharacterized protein n=1 Tax=Colletotrichum tabaci TaxID=1209068 RepID=A0AAV9T5E1_9PEZI